MVLLDELVWRAPLGGVRRDCPEWKLVLQDLLLPGGIGGIETTRRLLARRPGVKVIALTALVDEPRMLAVLRAGALGYVRKDADPEVLLAAVRRVAAGRPYIDPGVTTHLMHAITASDELTAREVEVMRELARGRSNKEIAASLAISEETIKTHVGHVLGLQMAARRGHASARETLTGMPSPDGIARPTQRTLWIATDGRRSFFRVRC